MLTVQDAAWAAAVYEGSAKPLPPIQRLACRVTQMPTLPKWLSEVSWRTVIGALLLGGIIHITATLAVPLLSSGHAFAKLRDTLPANRMVAAAAAGAGQAAAAVPGAGLRSMPCAGTTSPWTRWW